MGILYCGMDLKMFDTRAIDKRCVFYDKVMNQNKNYGFKWVRYGVVRCTYILAQTLDKKSYSVTWLIYT
jgi:hypothetical protein